MLSLMTLKAPGRVREPKTRAVGRSEELHEAELSAPSGDRDALGLLLKEHGPSIQQLCYFVAGPADSADATQESFERIVTSIQRFDPSRGAFRSWALTVARNVCRDKLRRRGLETKAFVPKGEETVTLAESHGADPERELLVRSQARHLMLALGTLPENQKTALVMFHFQSATYEEIAAVLEVPLGTVMTWLHRARKKLRAELDKVEA